MESVETRVLPHYRKPTMESKKNKHMKAMPPLYEE
jgi:hypothetical protein